MGNFRDRLHKRVEAKRKPEVKLAPTMFPSAKATPKPETTLTQRDQKMTTQSTNPTPALDTKSLGLGEQMIRIAMFTGGAYLFGDATVNSAEYQQFAGAVLQVAAFGWWAYRQWKTGQAAAAAK
jgi:hypothetical protein